MTKKIIELSLELARDIYKGDNEELKKLVLENFSKEELENKQKKWEDFWEVLWYYISDSWKIFSYHGDGPYWSNKDTRPTKELAEAALALSQLCQWRDKVNDWWKLDWEENIVKYSIVSYENVVCNDCAIGFSRIMTFKTEEIRDQFMKDHKDLLEIAKPLL